MTTIDIEKILHRQNQDKEDSKPPPQYVIMLHANPRSTGLPVLFAITHILVDHLGLSRNDAASIMRNALRNGRHVVKTVSKDLGETLIGQVNKCDLARTSSDYKFSLELA